MRVYRCDECEFTTTDVNAIYLMPDGETEYCEPCEKANHGN